MCWQFEIEDRLCAGPRGKPFLFGGVALAAAVEAMERSVGRPVIWANIQYHSFAVPMTRLMLETRMGGVGKRLTQARLTGSVADRTVITAQATLGAADDRFDRQWINAPSVTGWRDCPVVRDDRVYQTGINTQFEFRLAGGRYPDGRSFNETPGDGHVVLWVRPTDRYPIDRPMLAIIADYVSVAVCDAIGCETGANSLDNTIRFSNRNCGNWVLADMRIEAIARGVAHGSLHLFSETGMLLATANTSLVIRPA